jgi:hypothetical protein
LIRVCGIGDAVAYLRAQNLLAERVTRMKPGGEQRVAISEMNEQQAREFVEMLAVPEAADPPPCPLCGHRHQLETKCSGLRHAAGRVLSDR